MEKDVFSGQAWSNASEYVYAPDDRDQVKGWFPTRQAAWRSWLQLVERQWPPSERSITAHRSMCCESSSMPGGEGSRGSPIAQDHEAEVEMFWYGSASESAVLLNKVFLSTGDKPQSLELTTRSHIALRALVSSELFMMGMLLD